MECPRCRSDRTVKNGSYRAFQRYLCEDCDRTFNDKTGTVFAYSKVALRKWLFSICAFLRFNTSLHQLQIEIGVTYEAVHRHVERFTKALNPPSLNLVGSVEVDEIYVTAGKKGRDRDRPSRSRGLSTRGRGSYQDDKPPVFILVDRGTEQRYVIPAKAADESTIRLLLETHQQESLTVRTDGFRAYDPLEDGDSFSRRYVVHGEGEYADEDVHVNACESHRRSSDAWLSPHRGLSKDSLTRYPRAFQLRRQLLHKPGREALRHAIQATL